MVKTWRELKEFWTTEGVLMYIWLVWGDSIAVCVSLPEDVGGLRSKSGALLVEVPLGIGVDVALILHFLRKWQFLSVILPDPSNLISY